MRIHYAVSWFLFLFLMKSFVVRILEGSCIIFFKIPWKFFFYYFKRGISMCVKNFCVIQSLHVFLIKQRFCGFFYYFDGKMIEFLDSFLEFFGFSDNNLITYFYFIWNDNKSKKCLYIFVRNIPAHLVTTVI